MLFEYVAAPAAFVSPASPALAGDGTTPTGVNNTVVSNFS